MTAPPPLLPALEVRQVVSVEQLEAAAMSNSGIEVTFECQYCGGTVLALPEDYTDESIAQCNDCGADIGRWGDIKAVARKQAVDDALTAGLHDRPSSSDSPKRKRSPLP